MIQAGEVGVCADDKGHLFAVDLSTGELRWSERPGLWLGDQVASPVLWNDLAVFGGLDGVIYAMAPSTGEIVWKLDLETGFATELLLSADSVYVGGEDKVLYRVDLESRAVRSQIELPVRPEGTPMLAGDAVVVTDSATQLIALDRELEGILWQREDRWSTEQPLVDGDLLIVGTWEGELAALALADGETVWRVELGGKGIRGLGQEGSILYVGTYQGPVYSYRMPTESVAD